MQSSSSDKPRLDLGSRKTQRKVLDAFEIPEALSHTGPVVMEEGCTYHDDHLNFGVVESELSELAFV